MLLLFRCGPAATSSWRPFAFQRSLVSFEPGPELHHQLLKRQQLISISHSGQNLSSEQVVRSFDLQKILNTISPFIGKTFCLPKTVA